MPRSRRALLSLAAAGGSVALGGCFGLSSDQSDTTPTATDTGTTPSSTHTPVATEQPAAIDCDSIETDIGGWPSYRRDPANRCHVPDAELGQTPAVEWTVASGEVDEQVGDGDQSYSFDQVFSQPAVADGMVVTGHLAPGTQQMEIPESQFLVGYDLESGAERWRTRISSPDIAPPVVVGEQVVVRRDEAIRVFDLADGSPTNEADGVSARDSLLLATDAGVLSVGPDHRSVRSVTVPDLTERWRFELDTGAEIGPPVAAHGSVFVYSSNGDLAAIDATDGTPRWNRSVGYTPDGAHLRSAAPVVEGCRIVFPMESGLVCSDARDGEVRWEKQQPNGTVSVADGTVYTTTGDGTVRARSLDDGSEEWSTEMGRPDPSVDGFTLGLVATANQVLGFDNLDRLVAFDRSTGDPRILHESDGHGRMPVVLDDGSVVLGTQSELVKLS